MTRYLIGLIALFVAAPLAAQTVTSPVALVDSSPDTPGLVLSKMAARVSPPQPKGTRVWDCGSTSAPFVYALTESGCPKAQAATSMTIDAPRVTAAAKDFGSSGQIGYGDNSNVRAIRAMDAFPLRTNSSGKSIRDVIVDRARMLVTPEKSAALTINDVTIERVEANVTKRGIYVRGDSARWDIGHFRLAYVGATDDNNYPMGIQMNGTAHAINIHDGHISGFWSTKPDGYPNADGIVCERGNYDITIRRVTIEGSTDGAVDCKATGLRLDQVTAIDTGKRSFRFWGEATAGTLTSINPGWAHIWADAKGRITVEKLIAVGGGTLVDATTGASVAIKSCDLSKWSGATRVKGGGSVTLGEGCK